MNISNHIEALLFTAGEPVAISRLAKLLEISESEITTALNELEKNLEGRGIRLLKNGDETTLGTSPESAKYCENLVKEEMNKTIGKAGLETLAILLYKGAFEEKGLTRADIDYIRGVNTAFTLRNLSIRGLIIRETNPRDKRSFVYRPATQLLQYLGITKKEDLPKFEEFKKQLEDNFNDEQNTHLN